jgi:sodium-dependent dicarboxylate transporter 2/3/5
MTSKKTNNTYTARNKIGLIGGVIVLLFILISPAPSSMYNVAAKSALSKADAAFIEKAVAENIVETDAKGNVARIKDLDRFLILSKAGAPNVYSSMIKKTSAMKGCLAVMMTMVIWWICESLPWGVTALLPVALFPLLGVANAKATCAPYGNPTILFFIAAFFIAQALLKWNLHTRIALAIVSKIGVSPKRIVLGFMAACAFLSMLISNTATTMMMMPMALAIILHTAQVGQRLQEKGQLQSVDFSAGKYVFGSCLMLGIAFSANSGGMGTIIGTPPNMIFAGQLAMLFPNAPKVDFANWLILGLPLCIVTTLAIWFLLVYVLRRPDIKEIPGGANLIKEERSKLGPWSKGEKVVGIILLLTALAWIFRAEKMIGGVKIFGLSTLFPWIHDSTIAIIAAILLFCIPISLEKNEFALSWDWAVKIPWGIVLLFGGGFSLAAGLTSSGAATWIASLLTGLAGMPLFWLMLVIALVVAAVSTVATNTATATVFMPILGTLAIATSFDPRFLMALGALASQCAYALPVSTTCNAICFGSGYIRMMDMFKYGLIISVIGVLIVVAGLLVLGGPSFGMSPYIIPAWLK